jgi:hypothetical protein
MIHLIHLFVDHAQCVNSTAFNCYTKKIISKLTIRI